MLFKRGLDLRALLATFGFIAPQAGPDAICSWRSGKNLSAFPSRRPVKLASLRLTLQPDSKHSQQSDAGLFSQNAFFPAQNRRNAPTSVLLAWTNSKIYIRCKDTSKSMQLFQPNSKTRE